EVRKIYNDEELKVKIQKKGFEWGKNQTYIVHFQVL
ncbi:unnamed protein product, partial [marine sediment metagenome]